MPIFTAIAAVVTSIAAAVGFSAAAAATIGAVGAFAARTLLTIGISKLLSNTTDSNGSNPPAGDPRAQKSPTTVNKIPVIYGSAYVGPTITDAILSTDQQTMYYVCALGEVTDTGTLSFGNIYYNGDLIALGTGGDAAKVLSLTNNAVPPQTDTKIAGNMFVYLFNDGSSSGINTGGLTAIQILSDASIPVDSRWSSTDTMTNCAFAVIKLNYNTDAGTTQIGQLKFQLTNTLDEPGSVIYDYLTNSVYGCAIPVANVDTASLDALDVYSNELIDYIPVGGGTATQARYRINGPINTGATCLSNLQDLCDACDSWLQYSELTGQWKVVINQSYEDYTTFNDLYLIDSSKLIGGIDINPIDLNNTYNSLEVAYPDVNIQDQTNYKVFNLIDYVPEVMSPNEPANQLSVGFPQVNNYIQAAYLGERRMLQSREDLVITCALDYSGIQIEAGDVVRVTLAEYGWDEKLFRVSQVQEVKDESGFLGARITAFEYNNTIYANDPLNDFIPEANTGLTNPKWLDTPGTPTITTSPLANGTVASFSVTSTTPAVGSTMFMDFNYGLTSNVDTHKSYTTVQTSDGTAFAVSSSVTINVVNLPPDIYYWSTTARTTETGYKSLASSPYTWGGPNITTYDPGTGLGGISTNNISNNSVTSSKMSNTGVTAGSYTNSNITVDGAGRITLAANGTSGGSSLTIQNEGTNVASSASLLNFTGAGVEAFGISGGANIYITGYYKNIGQADFVVPNTGANTVTMPVNITSTSTRNIPVYITGTDPGSSYYYPYFQGTSSTANGYFANSTSALNPARASILQIDDGTDHWYRILQTSLSETVYAGNTLIHNFLLQVVSDTDDTYVQIVPGMTPVSQTNDVIFTPFITTIRLMANMPYYHTITRLGQTVGTYDCDKGGLWIRNMTAGSTIYTIVGQYQGRGPL